MFYLMFGCHRYDSAIAAGTLPERFKAVIRQPEELENRHDEHTRILSKSNLEVEFELVQAHCDSLRLHGALAQVRQQACIVRHVFGRDLNWI